MATGLTKDGLLAVFPGMKTNDVVAVLGKPLYVENDAWIFSEPGVCGQGLEVYVLIQSNQVRSVGVENHDLGIYWWREKERGPTIMDEILLNRLPGTNRNGS